MIDPAVMNRLRWHCRRGMLELDAWLAPFLEGVVPGLTADEQQAFVRLLEAEDDDLYGWLTGRENPPVEVSALVELIKEPRS